MSSEQQRIETLSRLFGRTPAPGVDIGIGDDAAVLERGRGKLVWTVDAAVEGVHFRRDFLSFEDIGYRSMMAATSDLAAMGASPRGALSALVLPREVEDTELEALARGQEEAAREVGMAVIGGNLARGTELSITTTVLGEAERPLLREGARPSDLLALAGPVGLARAGLLALLRGLDAPALTEAMKAWRRPLARMEAGFAASPLAHASIDLSDGLSLDSSRLAKASGVGVILDAKALLAHGGPTLLDAAGALSEDPLELMLEGGEDYAVLIACPKERVPPGFAVVGECIAGRGLWLRGENGELREIGAKGFDHFG